jgi:hypothetical protein
MNILTRAAQGQKKLDIPFFKDCQKGDLPNLCTVYCLDWQCCSIPSYWTDLNAEEEKVKKKMMITCAKYMIHLLCYREDINPNEWNFLKKYHILINMQIRKFPFSISLHKISHNLIYPFKKCQFVPSSTSS